MVPSPPPGAVRLSLAMRRSSGHWSRLRPATASSTPSVGRTRVETGNWSIPALCALSTSPTRPSYESPHDDSSRASERRVRGGSVALSRGKRANKRSRARESLFPGLHPGGHVSIRPAAAGRGISGRRSPAGDSGALRIRRRWLSTRNSSRSRRPGPT
jgi:hypothetical protein